MRYHQALLELFYLFLESIMNRRTVIALCVVTMSCTGAPEPTSTLTNQETSLPGTNTAESIVDGVDVILETPTIEDGQLVLHGTANVPDGAILMYLVKHDGFDSGDYDGYEVGHVDVMGGVFRDHVPVSDWPEGYALTRLTFQMNPEGREQPEAVLEEYGENGERLQGPRVTDFAGIRKIEINVTTAIQ